MKPIEIPVPIQAQPDDSSCGPTCLQALYAAHGDAVELGILLRDVPKMPTGGTLAVLLGCHALERGYEATVYTFNLAVFDLTWFGMERGPLLAKLAARRPVVEADERTRIALDAYARFVELGGDVRCEDIRPALLRRYLKQGLPLLAGLSATYLYGTPRELGEPMRYDDVHGQPQGHFVVVCGYDPGEGTALVADPLRPNPLSTTPRYRVPMDRLVCAVMLGVLTYDANLLVLRPPRALRSSHARPVRRRPRS